MPPEAQAQVAETVVTPTPPVVPDRSTQDKESVSEKMERLGWDKNDKHDANPNALGAKSRAASKERRPVRPTAEPAPAASEAETTEEAKPDAVAEAAADAGTPDPSAEKRAQLKAIVADLGLMLEDDRVTTKERAEIRIARDRVRDEQRRIESEAMARIEAATKGLEEREKGFAPREAKLAEFDKAVSDADHEAIAKIAGFENWDKFQEHIIALKADPAYRRLRALEQETAARNAREKAAEEKAEADRVQREMQERQTADERAAAQARGQYMQKLSATMAASENPLIRAMHDDPNFVGAIYHVQASRYDRATDATVTPEEALKIGLGQSQPLEAELRKLWERLHPIFGAPGSAPAKPATAAAPKQRVEQPRANRTPNPTPPIPARRAKFDDQAWKKNAEQRLSEAVREDMAAARKRA